MLIFFRISAATLHGRQKMSSNFTEILKAKKFHVVCLLIRYFFHNFVPFGITIAEYNNWPKLKKQKEGMKKKGGGKIEVCPGKSTQIWENYEIMYIIPDLSEKIMACMHIFHVKKTIFT